MFGHSWKLARIAGIEIRIDSSWLIIAVFIAYSFFFRFGFLYEDLETGPRAALAVVSALVFFSSVLIHEFAHSLVAQARGIPVKNITLFLFGGATQAKVESRSPRDEFIIAAVGPLTSFGLAAVLWGLAAAAGNPADPVPGTIGYLAWVNLALAVFNLLPGLPLDGGRLLRSALWGSTDDINKATRIASDGGRFIGYGLIGLGVWLLLAGAGGLWLILIGWFLSQAARASYTQLRLSRLLRGVHADDVMSSDLVCIDADMPLERAVDEYFLRHDHAAFPVVRAGDTIGLITLRGVRRVPSDERAQRSVADTMLSLDDALKVGPDHPLENIVELFAEEDGRRVLVTKGDDVVGIVSPSDVNRWVRRSEELDLPGRDEALAERARRG